MECPVCGSTRVRQSGWCERCHKREVAAFIRATPPLCGHPNTSVTRICRKCRDGGSDWGLRDGQWVPHRGIRRWVPDEVVAS